MTLGQNDVMTEWRYDRKTLWQNDVMTNDVMKEWRYDKMTLWKNDVMLACCWHKIRLVCTHHWYFNLLPSVNLYFPVNLLSTLTSLSPLTFLHPFHRQNPWGAGGNGVQPRRCGKRCSRGLGTEAGGHSTPLTKGSLHSHWRHLTHMELCHLR